MEIILYLKEKVLDMGNQAYDLTWARIGQDVTIWEHSKIIKNNGTKESETDRVRYIKRDIMRRRQRTNRETERFM